MDDLTTLFCQVPADPTPGHPAVVRMSNGMDAVLLHPADQQQLTNQSRSLRYVPARAVGDTAHVHAAINRRINGRNRLMEVTLCSQGEDGRVVVAGTVRGSLQDTVTCPECRSDLDGETCS